MQRRRVVVTGLGIISPVGNTVPEAWDAVLAGKSGITRVTRFDPSRLASQIAGEVKDFDVSKYLSPKEARRMDRFIHFGMAAGLQAWQDSGNTVTPETAERFGIVFGSGMGGLPLIEEMHNELLKSGPRRISPFFIPGTIINMIAGNLSIMLGTKGPNLGIVTACTTSTHCIGEAAKSIRYGESEVMIAGGAEATVTELAMGGFASARALSTRNDDPATASRPWDKDRDGFVLGEGAGAVVLEELEHAKQRGARIYCELVGYGVSSDAYHMTAPAEDGDGAFRCMTNALRDAGIGIENIDYINAHGTSTHCLGEAAKSIRYGEAEVMIAGGAEATVTELAMGGFASARALSTRNDDPAGASRPWDKDRDGFVLGVGAGAVVLEEYEYAKKRGARIYCELAGYGVSSDAYHMTAPAEDGEGAYRCMKNALRDSGLALDSVDYINAHGTSTGLGDIAETVAVKRFLGDRAMKVAVNSTKSMTGHLLGAAGGIEAVFSILALVNQVSPPTINLQTPDPACDLDYVPNTARKMSIRTAISNSFGFGGTNGSLVFSRL